MTRALGLALCIGVFALNAACPQSGGGAVKVEKVEPPQGTTAGGEEVTIAGDGFSPGKTQAEVRFGHKKSEVVTIASHNNGESRFFDDAYVGQSQDARGFGRNGWIVGRRDDG